MNPISATVPYSSGASGKPEAPEVSVLIAAYGQEKYLGEALESLQRQTLTDWEAIIVDDGSPDRVAETARKYVACDSRIRFHHTDNHGVSAARNTAASMARGEYIICLDADDRFAPEYLDRCVKAFHNNPDLKVAYAKWKFFGDNIHTPSIGYTDFRNELLNNAVHVSAMIRRSDFLATGGFDTSMLSAMEDWEFWIRFLRKVRPENILLINSPLFLYRQKKCSRNNVGTIDYERHKRLQQYIFSKHRDTYITIVGENASADMLMLLNAEMYDLIFNTDRMVESMRLPYVLSFGIRSAKRLSRNRNFNPEICLRYIVRIAETLRRYQSQGADQLKGSERRSLNLLISNPQKFMRRTRLIQRLMPKNWGKSQSRLL